MTAIVGIINRLGVAFAADSAATHTSSTFTKISNTANKIFSLSRKHPVGIALYNNLDFHGIPWEVIIKRYRDSHLKNKSFPKIMDYVNDFWNYLAKDILKKIPQEEQMQHVAIYVLKLKNEILHTAKDELSNAGVAVDSVSMFDKMSTILRGVVEKFRSRSTTPGFKKYKKDDFEKYARDVIDKSINDLITDAACPHDFRNLFVEALYQLVISDINIYTSYTGLIFWGYGEEELFPSYYHYTISLAFDNCIKYFKTDEYVVSNSNNACVAPFAQTDVANTVVRGVDQKLREAISKEIKKSYGDFRNGISDVLANAGAPTPLLEAIDKVDVGGYASSVIVTINKFIQENYVDKLLQTVAFLSKEDLADMAESLVRMTCLKRHVTTDAESVGGPVDVAVITKGDGFVWIKRKHYFDAGLNHDYVERTK